MTTLRARLRRILQGTPLPVSRVSAIRITHLLLEPSTLELAGRLLSGLIQSRYEATALAARVPFDTPLITMVGHMTGLPGLWVYSTTHVEHAVTLEDPIQAVRAKVLGRARPQVVLLESVTPAPTDTALVIDRLAKDAEADVVAVVSLVDRSQGEAARLLKTDFVSVFTTEDL